MLHSVFVIIFLFQTLSSGTPDTTQFDHPKDYLSVI